MSLKIVSNPRSVVLSSREDIIFLLSSSYGSENCYKSVAELIVGGNVVIKILGDQVLVGSEKLFRFDFSYYLTTIIRNISDIVGDYGQDGLLGVGCSCVRFHVRFREYISDYEGNIVEGGYIESGYYSVFLGDIFSDSSMAVEGYILDHPDYANMYLTNSLSSGYNLNKGERLLLSFLLSSYPISIFAKLRTYDCNNSLLSEYSSGASLLDSVLGILAIDRDMFEDEVIKVEGDLWQSAGDGGSLHREFSGISCRESYDPSDYPLTFVVEDFPMPPLGLGNGSYGVYIYDMQIYANSYGIIRYDLEELDISYAIRPSSVRAYFTGSSLLYTYSDQGRIRPVILVSGISSSDGFVVFHIISDSYLNFSGINLLYISNASESSYNGYCSVTNLSLSSGELLVYTDLSYIGASTCQVYIDLALNEYNSLKLSDLPTITLGKDTIQGIRFCWLNVYGGLDFLSLSGRLQTYVRHEGDMNFGSKSVSPVNSQKKESFLFISRGYDNEVSERIKEMLLSGDIYWLGDCGRIDRIFLLSDDYLVYDENNFITFELRFSKDFSD